MLTTVDVMPDTARLWVYQSDRNLSKTEIEWVRQRTQLFLDQWAAHGQGLTASYLLEHDQFLILMVDERHEAASGCSIDASVSLIRELEQYLGNSFLDRSKVAILKDNKVQLLPLNGIKKAIAEGVILPNTSVFNNSVCTFGEWKSQWQQPASSSWMARFFN